MGPRDARFSASGRRNAPAPAVGADTTLVFRWNTFSAPGVAGVPSFTCPWATGLAAGTPSVFQGSPARLHSRARGRQGRLLEHLRYSRGRWRAFIRVTVGDRVGCWNTFGVPGVAGAPSFACPWATG